ncbi:MAG: zinc-binding dehydrogenase [Chitinivibrionales bacterium]|nr:zinc-binding dehydrogenase [Chitinivibrionales bacterium]
MKAIQLVEIGKPLQEREIPLPLLGDQDVLIKVKAAGICHSDAHYRRGVSPVSFLPMSPGHEVSGIVEEVGTAVTTVTIGQRVCLHYLATCGSCRYCRGGTEQFCSSGEMIGKNRPGGYAEYIAMPQASVVPIPEAVSFEHAAVMMCSTATSFHALRKASMHPGDRVAVFGAGGLGISAVQLAMLMGCVNVIAIDIDDKKLAVAARFGAQTVNASLHDPVPMILDLTGGQGVDVALELIGLPLTMQQSVRCLATMGRAVMVGLSNKSVEIDIYKEVLGKEAQIIGCSDHLLSELPLILEFGRQGRLDFSSVVTKQVALEANAINATLDALDHYKSSVRTVICP